jgi:hypothetical protein
MVLLKAPYDVEEDKKKKLDKLKKQIRFSNAIKCSVKIPRNTYLDLKKKLFEDNNKKFQTLMMELINNYMKNE